MPRTRYEQRIRRYDKVVAIIYGTLKVRDENISEFANAVDMSTDTLGRRFKSPENFTLNEISRIGRHLGIPIEELRQCIMY